MITACPDRLATRNAPGLGSSTLEPEWQGFELNNVVLNRASLRTAELPAFQGIALADVRLVDSEALAGEALDALINAGEIGFDTESKPTFAKGEATTGPHLVQLATESCVYLFQISRLHGNNALKAILESPRVLKVGFGLGNDRSALQSRLDIETNKLLDLGEVLRGPGHRGTVGAKVAVAHFFAQKFQKSKKTSTSNWAAPNLTERQILYAANDAHVALRIYRAWVKTGSVAFTE
jgi:ribonuclease D